MSAERKRLVRALDTVFSQYIRKRDESTCYTCGRGLNHGLTMQCGHLLTRSCYSTRWDENNAKCQCSGCNITHEFHPETFTLKYIQQHGLPAYEALVYKHKSVAKFSSSDLKILIEYYRAKMLE
jgi:hypothetical protein